MNNIISSRAVIGMYYEALAALSGMGWMGLISNYFNSDQDQETYPWLGMPPALREWIGGRQAKGLSVNYVVIKNVLYEATIEFLLKDLRRDKTGQVRARINEFAERGNSHFASLLSTLILNGASTVCYDGQYFFDTDHSEGNSGTQSNKINVDISTLPASVHGAVTAPSPEEMQQAILLGIAQILTFVDDQGEPLNETAQQFHVTVPVGLQAACLSALTMVRQGIASSFDMTEFKISMSVNPRLTIGGWTDKFAIFRTDGSIKPLIRQEEYAPETKLKDEQSEYAFDNKAIQIGLDTSRSVGYGRWQGAAQVTLI